MSASTPAAIGILGGTFDPIHYGHLRLAQEVAQTLALREIRFIPAGTPPLRAAPRAAAAHRVAMVRLAIAGNPLFTLDERETHRGGPSYTFDTLTELRAELGAARPLTLIMGMDAFLGLDKWHRWREIFRLAHIAVAHRPGAALGAIGENTRDAALGNNARDASLGNNAREASLAQEFQTRRVHDIQALASTAAGAIAVVPIPPLDISATAIRAAIAAGRSARYLTPDTVIEYINDKYLFLKGI